MKLILQRVKSAHVEVNKEIVGQINTGILVYVCFEIGDDKSHISKAVQKISKLRIFEDEEQKMNLDINQVSGEILSVSQFTLSWDGRKGNRPSFDLSMPPEKAKLFYEDFNRECQNLGLKIKIGTFGADMKVHSINDGPVTFSFTI